MILFYLAFSACIIVFLVICLQWVGLIPSRFLLKEIRGKEIILQRRKGLTKTIPVDRIIGVAPLRHVTYEARKYHNFGFQLENGECVSFVISRNMGKKLRQVYDVMRQNLIAQGLNVYDIDFRQPNWLANARKSVGLLRVGQDSLCWTKGACTKELPYNTLIKIVLDEDKGELEFENGVVLKKLETFCYWPLLRDFLLDKLESKKMHNLPS